MRLFHQLSQISFFQKYRVWKSFFYWKKLIRKEKSLFAQRYLETNLFILNEHLRDPLRELHRICCDEVEKYDLFKIDTKKTVKLADYLQDQDNKRAEIAEKLQKFQLEVKKIIAAACEKDLISFLIKNKFRKS